MSSVEEEDLGVSVEEFIEGSDVVIFNGEPATFLLDRSCMTGGRSSGEATEFGPVGVTEWTVQVNRGEGKLE